MNGAQPPTLARLDALALLGLGLAVRVPLVFAFPGIHGDDSVARLAMSDRIVLAYQLPLPQLLVFLARAVHPDPLWTRLVFVAIGALVPVALAHVVAATSSPVAGRCAGALLALHPLFTYYSLVPYQEGPMLLFLLMAANALLAQRERAAGVACGLASLCRYEAWIAAALAIVDRRRRLVRALLLFGWAPIAWALFWGGLSPSGSYVLDVDPAGGSRFARLPFLFTKLRAYSGGPLLALAAAGAAVAVWRRRPAHAWAAAYVVAFLAVVSLAGHEFPPGSGLVSERLAHVPAAAVCALAGLALGAAAGGTRHARLRLLAVAAVVAAIGIPGLRRAVAQLHAANSDPSLRLAVEVARRAHVHLGPGERLAVAAPPLPPEALDDYVRKIGRLGGDVRRAREMARAFTRLSPDAGRIAAHLPRPPSTVVPTGSTASLLAVFDDAPEAAAWQRGTALGRFAAGTRAVTLYRTDGPQAPPRKP